MFILEKIPAREAVFYIVLSAPIIAVVIVVYCDTTQELAFVSSYAIELIISSMKIVTGDISILGEATPIVLSTLIIALVPPNQDGVRYIGAILCAATYVTYIYFSYYFTSGPGVGIISAIDSDVETAQKSILEHRPFNRMHIPCP